MVNLASRREQFIQGMMENAGWHRNQAEEHFDKLSAKFEIQNEAEFVKSEAKRLREYYPKVTVAPMIYLVEDGRLYLVDEG
jgi:carbonic anhydrase